MIPTAVDSKKEMVFQQSDTVIVPIRAPVFIVILFLVGKEFLEVFLADDTSQTMAVFLAYS